MEPFLPENEDCNVRSNGMNRVIIRRESMLTNCVWGSRMTRKLLKLQLMCILALVWLGLAIYGCDFPIKVFLNQILISIYFAIVYSFGLTVGYYAMHTVTVCGIRVASLLQVVSVIASGLFGYLCFQSLAEHAERDRNPITRIWASILYAAIILTNGLVMAAAVGLAYQGFSSTCKWPRRNRNVCETQVPKDDVPPGDSEPEEA